MKQSDGFQIYYLYSIDLSITPPSPLHPPIIEEEPTYGFSKEWVEMIFNAKMIPERVAVVCLYDVAVEQLDCALGVSSDVGVVGH